MMKKVLLVTNVPTPYRVPLFQGLNTAYREAGWELTVAFGERGYTRRKYTLQEDQFGFKHIFLNGGKKQDSSNPEATVFLYRGLMHHLLEINPDHVIVSGFSPATVRVWWWSITHRKTFSIWSGTIPQRGKSFGYARTLFRRLIASKASGFLAYGTEARRYLLELGLNAEKIDIATNTVDTAFFKEQTAKCRERNQNDDQPFTFTYIGYLVPRKKVEQILFAAGQLKKQRNDFRIRIVGDGTMRESLDSLAREMGIADSIVFEGHKQISELPAILAQTDVFLFQTGFDIWGLVLNEAMAAGIASIASIHGGATTDLIRDEVNGFSMDYAQTDSLTARMSWCIDHPVEIRSMGLHASKYVEDNAGIEKAVRIFISHTIKFSRGNP